VQGADACILREAEVFGAGCAAGREALLKEQAAVEQDVTRPELGRALEQALVRRWRRRRACLRPRELNVCHAGIAITGRRSGLIPPHCVFGTPCHACLSA